MAKPSQQEYRSLLITTAPPADRVYRVESALRSLEGGIFRDAAIMCDGMLRDDRVAGCLQTRVNGVLGLDLEMCPAIEDDASSQLVADDANDAFTRMYPTAALSELLRWGLLLGVGVGELVWDTSEEGWEPTLKVWHPQFLRWDITERAYKLQTDEGAEIVIEPGDGKWVIFTPYGYEYGWLRGLVRSLARPWLIRQWTYRDWARYSEVHGLPIRKAIIPASASGQEKSLYINQLAAISLGSESTIRLPRDEQDKGYDLQLLEATANTYLGFEKLLEKCETSIAVNILGQNLSTEVQGGSFAAAKTHADVRADLMRFDALALGDALRDQSLKFWALYNHGDTEAAPYIHWMTDPPEDESEAAKALDTLADALVKFKAAGAPVDMRELLEAAGVPMLEEADVAEAVKHPQAIGGQREPEPAPAFGAAAGGPTVPGAVTPGTPPPPAPNGPSIVANKRVVALKARMRRSRQYWVEALAKNTKADTARALKPDVAALKEEIAMATSYDDLKRRLVHRYGFMQPHAMADVMRRANLLARMNGRYSIMEAL
jgi:phage gp29-like protein